MESEPPSSKRSEDDAGAGAKRAHPLERFTVERIGRLSIKEAEYNPREITDTAREKLQAGLEALGMLQPIVFNRRSGRVVGGHQRLAILDDLANGVADYTLQVSMVELSDAEEQEANILLNNAEAMGHWDLAKLDASLRVEGLRVEATGFDVADIFQILGNSPFQETNGEALEALANAQRAVQESLDAITKALAGGRDNDDFYICVVFKDVADRHEFATALGLDDNTFQDGNRIRKLLVAKQPEAGEAAPPSAME